MYVIEFRKWNPNVVEPTASSDSGTSTWQTLTTVASWTTPSYQQFILSSLTPNSAYVFRCKCRNLIGWSTFSINSKPFFTEKDCPNRMGKISSMWNGSTIDESSDGKSQEVVWSLVLNWGKSLGNDNGEKTEEFELRGKLVDKNPNVSEKNKSVSPVKGGLSDTPSSANNGDRVSFSFG